MKKTLSDQAIFDTFFKPGEVIEVRIPTAHGKSPAWCNEWARGIVSGYFDNYQAFCEAVRAANKAKHDGIYFTLQKIDPRLLGRAFNRLKPATVTTKDHNVTHYRWIPIDIDAQRPAGISSSDKELAAALKLRDGLAGWGMKEFGLSEPTIACSGNGGHLLFNLKDSPATGTNKGILKAILEAFAGATKTRQAEVDVTVFNPARIWKLYGTTAKKGDALPAGKYREARPHRQSYIESIGQPCNKALSDFSDLVKVKPNRQTSTTATGGTFDLKGYLDHYGAEVIREKPYKGGTLYGLKQCVFDPDHSHNDASFIQAANGRLGYQCFHNGCTGKGWKEARQQLSGNDNLRRFMSTTNEGNHQNGDPNREESKRISFSIV